MKYIDVSDWGDSIGQGTTGTREKEILVNPQTNKDCFLKYSMSKPGRDYATEYWSEIIAYEIGKFFGFNVLEYDLAEKDGRFGCISENMVDTDQEQLIEGVSILSAYDSSYNPKDKNMYDRYTFPFVREALNNYGYGKFIFEFIDILIFDAVIGNSDRHQGNWGFIHKRESPEAEQRTKRLKKMFKSLGGRSKVKEDKSGDKMAPIYDSGCCLGREFSEEQVSVRLKDSASFDSFIRKGIAELRRADKPEKKIPHTELLSYIMSLDQSYRVHITNRIKGIEERYSPEQIESIVLNIDKGLSKKTLKQCGLSETRKHFICKVIETRLDKLKELI